jgi:hypothetical protein
MLVLLIGDRRVKKRGESMRKCGFLLVECAVALVLLATVGFLVARFLGTEACRTVRFAYTRALINRLTWVAEGGAVEEKVPGVTVMVQMAQEQVMLLALLPSVHALDTKNESYVPVTTINVQANGTQWEVKRVGKSS